MPVRPQQCGDFVPNFGQFVRSALSFPLSSLPPFVVKPQPSYPLPPPTSSFFFISRVSARGEKKQGGREGGRREEREKERKRERPCRRKKEARRELRAGGKDDRRQQRFRQLWRHKPRLFPLPETSSPTPNSSVATYVCSLERISPIKKEEFPKATRVNSGLFSVGRKRLR